MSSYSCHRHCQQSPGQECAAAGETESRGCSAHLGPAPCWVWGEPSPENAERWVCPRTSTAHLLLALMASHGAAHPRHGDRSCSSLGTSAGLAFFLQGSRNEPQLMSSLWLLTCSPPAGQGPWQFSLEQAWTCTAMAGTQHHRPLRRGRGRPCPSPQSPAAHVGLLRGVCQGGPPHPRGCHPCGQQAQGRGAATLCP